MRNFRWYMISTVSGKEEQVIEALKNRVVSEQISEFFDETACETGAFKMFIKPTLTAKEAEKKLKGEPYKVKYVNMYNGYIFIKMEMDDYAWFVIRNTQYVTGLIGSSGKGSKPTPVSGAQIQASFKKEKLLQEEFDAGIEKDKFSIGEIVEIIDGPFKGTQGKVLKCDDRNQRVLVEIEYFGKNVPTDFDFEKVVSREK
ncbi:transcription termination/antitermination protein NusG [Mycoplasmopsis felifaucium]|uniref:Transcription termination/antitermination protein NusG n=1 Tax=Mycoplasmopsis felifaucium TaxID=35768 RepID=A0ABZ2RPU1_9BACT